MTDISDGLGGDLGHIREKSGVGARLYAAALPVAPENRVLALAARGDEWHFALQGGEDYELLFTAPKEAAAGLVDLIRRETGTAVSVIGEIVEASRGVEFELSDGRVIPLEARGWDHMKAGKPEEAE